MKKIIFICILFILFSLSVFPDSFETRFLNANSFYEKGDFKSALDIYLELEKDIANWKIYYNIGNSYFKLRDPVRAKIYYLKAQRFDSFNESTKKNLEIVERFLNNNIHLPDPGFISKVLMKIESFLTLDILTIILVLLLIIFAYFEFMLITKGKRKKLIYGILLSFIMVILFSSYHMLRANKFNRNKLAVVIVKESKLRSGPGTANTVLFDVSPGVTIRIVDSNRDWVQVTASSEIAGWIEKNNIERIK